MATTHELAQIWRWNQSVPASVDRFLHDIIQERIDTQPDAAAVSAWDGDLIYAELGRFATALARLLVYQGVSPDTTPIVPLCFEKSRWTAVGMLGVLKTGVGFVMIDSHQPEHRLRSIVHQVGADIIVSSLSMAALSSRLAPRTLVVSSSSLDHPLNRTDPNLSRQDPSSVAYVAFTSGSTGEPKGALISHRNVASALFHQQQLMGFDRTTRFYDFSSYSFDASIGVFFTTLSAGGCICVPSEDDRCDNLVQSITSLGANMIDLTPSVAGLLSPQLVPKLQTLILGGESLQVHDISRWWDEVRVISFYGPCAGLVTWIAHPENDQSLVPLGTVGELLLEGPLVGLGYLQSQERTAACFIEDPIWLLAGSIEQPGRQGRLYKTGDLVRYCDDGSLIFVGRKDTQIKIRGQRIELSEIENTLRGHASVHDAVAVLQKDEEIGSVWITAFVTLVIHGPAFQDSDTAQRIGDRSIDEPNSPDCGRHDRPRLLPKRDFTKWELMYDATNTDSVGRWLTGMIDPMATGTESSNPLGNCCGFVLFGLPTVLSSENNLSQHEGAIKFIRRIIDSIPAVERTVYLFKANPADLGTNRQAISSGLVVLSAITHMFPSLAYLFNVIKETSKLEGVETVIFGRVYSNASYRESLAESAFRTSRGTVSSSELRRIVKVESGDSKLLVHPEFFATLPGKLPDDVAYVEIMPNETEFELPSSPFEYTVIIHINHRPKLLIESSANSILPFVNIPYSRVVHGRRLLEVLQSEDGEGTNQSDMLLSTCIESDQRSFSIRDLIDIAKRTDRRVKVSWDLPSSDCGSLTAVFYQEDVLKNETPVLFQLPGTSTSGSNAHPLSSQPGQCHVYDSIEPKLIEVLKARLPSYMIPRAFKVLSRFPLNSNCKIDRKTLQSDIQRGIYQGGQNVASGMLSESEKRVCQIWGNALGIEPATIGRNDRFFDIGGDSITAIKVVIEARKAGLILTTQDVFCLEVYKIAEYIKHN